MINTLEQLDDLILECSNCGITEITIDVPIEVHILRMFLGNEDEPRWQQMSKGEAIERGYDTLAIEGVTIHSKQHG